MTRDEFNALMIGDGWNEAQQRLWRTCTPLCDADTFRREMARPDGMIEVQFLDEKTPSLLKWTRMFQAMGKRIANLKAG